MHIHLVIFTEVGNKEGDITGDGTLRSSIRANIWPEPTSRLMPELTIIGKDFPTPKSLVLTGKLQRFRHFL